MAKSEGLKIGCSFVPFLKNLSANSLGGVGSWDNETRSGLEQGYDVNNAAERF